MEDHRWLQAIKVIIAHLLDPTTWWWPIPELQHPQNLLSLLELQSTAYTINSMEVIIIAELQNTLYTVGVSSVVLLSLHLQKVKGEQHQTKRSPLSVILSVEVVTTWWPGWHPQHGGDYCLQDLHTKELISYLQDSHPMEVITGLWDAKTPHHGDD